MGESKYCVVFKGEIQNVFDIESVKEKVSKAFKIESAKIDLLFSGKRIVVKKNGSYEECEAMRQLFEDAGAISYVEQEKINTTGSQGPPPLPDPKERKHLMANSHPIKQADEKFCSNCGAIIKIRSLSCPRCGQKLKKNGMGCLPIAAIGLAICFVGIAVIGILAAIAIPQFNAYRMRSYQAGVMAELRVVCAAENDFFAQNNAYTDSLEELGYLAKPNISIQIVEIENDCFQVKGEMPALQKRYFIDCNGEIIEEEISDDDFTEETSFRFYGSRS